MRIVFFGSPQIAIPSLQAIHESQHQIVGVISQPDKPRGRKLQVTSTAIKQLAQELGLKVMTPVDLNNDQFTDEYKSLDPEVNVVIAYGKIMPAWLIDYPSNGTINAHASLLPRWRGAAPIRRAIMAGDTKTGVTIQHVVKELDAGDIALQQELEINTEDNNETLSEKLSSLSAKLLVEALDLIKMAKLPKIKQNEADFTYAEKITKEEQQIDFNVAAQLLVNNIRGLAPKPGAHAVIGGKRLKILKAQISDLEGKPGEIIQIDKEGIVIGTADKAILLTKVQAEGGRPMSAYEYAKGHLK